MPVLRARVRRTVAVSVGTDEEMVMVPALSAEVDMVPRTEDLSPKHDQGGRGQSVGQQYGKKSVSSGEDHRRKSRGLGRCFDPTEQTDAHSTCHPSSWRQNLVA